MHLTFLESKGIKPYFYARGYTPDRVRGFKEELGDHLREEYLPEDKRVWVDQDRPLKVMGGGSLALNIVHTDRLEAVRESIEIFLVKQFGELPEMLPFDPHITLGECYADTYLTRRQRKNPEILLPGFLYPPDSVALNGLATYLGKIHAASSEMQTVA